MNSCLRHLPAITIVVLSLITPPVVASQPVLVPLDEASHRLVWSTEPGMTYSVEFSEDLAEWRKIEGFPVVAAGHTSEVLVHLTTPGRFFRVVTHFVSPLPGFSLVPPGVFVMGSPPDEPGRKTNEDPQSSVTLTRGFHVKQTPVTATEWTATRRQGADRGYTDLAVGNPGFNGEDDHPVTRISWWDALKWCNLLSEIDGRTPVYHSAAGFSDATVLRTGTGTVYVDWQANGYRLPTEAEWEYACRAGTTTAFFTGPITELTLPAIDPNLDLAGWYGGNTVLTQAVGLKTANTFGLFDTHGNVNEWCWDWFGNYPGDAIDPRGPASGSERVMRGGASFQSAPLCRSAARASRVPHELSVNIGFRPVATNR
jgi:formylglycine-generating enzyme required for sulfatase activity